MKYRDIKNFKSLKAYCYKENDMSVIYINPTSPFHNTYEGNYLGELHTSPSKALGYRLFSDIVSWCFVNVIRGVIYSYDTPIGLILNNSIVFVPSKQLPFKSATTKKLVTILNREFMSIELNQFMLILKSLKISLGWLE